MRHLSEIIRRTRSSFSRVLGKFNSRVKILENMITNQNKRISDLETKDVTSIHGIEMKEHNRRKNKDAKHNALNKMERRTDLEKEYGTTKWATRLINEIEEQRTLVRDISFSIAE